MLAMFNLGELEERLKAKTPLVCVIQWGWHARTLRVDLLDGHCHN